MPTLTGLKKQKKQTVLLQECRHNHAIIQFKSESVYILYCFFPNVPGTTWYSYSWELSVYEGCVLVFDIGPHLEHFSLSSYPPFHSLTFPSSLFTSFQSHQLCVNVTPPAGLFFFLPLGVVCELKAGSDSVTCDGFSSIIHWSSHQKEARSQVSSCPPVYRFI